MALLSPLPALAAGKLEDNSFPEVTWTVHLAVGERLVCAPGSWTDVSGGFSYAWYRGGQLVKSGGAGYGEYTLSKADEGQEVYCTVSAHGGKTNGKGELEFLEVESFNSVEIGHKAKVELPKNTTQPTVSGKAELGGTLSCSQGVWTGTAPITYTYRWLRDKVAIGTATSSSYTVTSEDEGEELSCKVTAENSGGSTPAESSNSLKITGKPPANVSVPTVKGIAEVGQTLTCSEGKWEGSQPITYKYQWLSGGVEVGGATASTYLIKAGDEGKAVSCRVTATNSAGGPVTAASQAVTIALAHLTSITPPEIEDRDGKAVGATLTCSNGTWSSSSGLTYTYEWLRGESQVIGSNRTYTVEPADEGQSLYCEVTASSPGRGSASRRSAQPFVIPEPGVEAPFNTGKPVLSGTAELGHELDCSEGKWNEPNSGLEFSFEWIRNPNTRSQQIIEGATEFNYRVSAADEGQQLACVVTAVNKGGSASAESTPVEVAGSAPVATTPAPEVIGNVRVGEALTCLSGGWAGTPKPEFSYEWVREGASIASGYGYTITAADAGHDLDCLVTAKNNQGEATADSAEVYVPGTPPDVGIPTIEGTPEPGKKLTCIPGRLSGAPAPEVKFSWQVNGETYPGETQPSFEVTIHQRGLPITCTVTVSSREGSQSATSAIVSVKGQSPQEFLGPSVKGTGAVGFNLTCEAGLWKGEPPPSFSYQWYRDGVAIAGQTEPVYNVEAADEGHVLTCNVVASNTEGRVEAESSNGISIAVRPPSSAAASSGGAGNGVQDFSIGTLPSGPSSTVVLADLTNQVNKAQQSLHIRTLLKDDGFTFSFTPPAAGTMDLFWYQVITTGSGAHRQHREILIGQSTAAFASTGKRTMLFVLTKKGRLALKGKKHFKLTVKAQFTVTHGKPVPLLEALTLSR